jgi:hypothetical protein
VANPQLVELADLHLTEDIRSRIMSWPISDYMASSHVARVVAAVQEGARSDREGSCELVTERGLPAKTLCILVCECP